MFSEKDKLLLLQVARESIHQKVNNNAQYTPLNTLDYPPLNKKSGAFVSVYHKTKLRGCLGRFQSEKPLYLLISGLAASAATADLRFSPILKEELDGVAVEISVLSPLKQIFHQNEIIIGKHGIYMKHGSKRGTLLPQVAIKQNWNALQFLEFCAKNKVGIGKNEWMNSELFVYEALVFHNRIK